MKTDPSQEASLSRRVQLRRAWVRLRGGQLTPARAAASVAIGLFIGVQPTPGLHAFLVVGICLALRLDAAVSYLAANISIPPIAPFLWFGAIQIGARLLHGAYLPLTVGATRTMIHHPGSLLGALAVGSVILGAAIALVGGSIAFVVAQWRTERAARPVDPLTVAIERTAERYAGATRSRGTYYYVRSKLRDDPSTRAVVALAPLGNVLDLGCGRGQLAVLLAESGAAQRVIGCDWDATKVALAQRAGEGLDVTFTEGDLRAAKGESVDTVLLVDVLHYFDRATQNAALLRAAARVTPGGRLVLRDADAARGWRSFVTKIPEAIGTAIRFNHGERVVFRDVSRDLVPLLEGAGFACTVTPCWAGTPFANVLLVATRAAAP